MSDVSWRSDVSAETLRLMRRELEWAIQHRRDKLVNRLPQNRLAMRTRQRIGLVAAVVLIAVSVWLWTQPGEPPALVVASTALGCIALVAVPFMPRYFAWTALAIGKRLAKRAEVALRPLEAIAPTTARYHLHDGRLEVHHGDRELSPVILRDVRTVVVTPHALFTFPPMSPDPHVMIFLPGSDHPLVTELENGGAVVTRADGPIARYGEWTALPQAIAADNDRATADRRSR